MRLAALLVAGFLIASGCARSGAANVPDAPGQFVKVTALEAMRDATITALVLQRKSVRELHDVAAGTHQVSASRSTAEVRSGH